MAEKQESITAGVITLALGGVNLTIASAGWPAGLPGLRMMRSALTAGLAHVEAKIDELLAQAEKPQATVDRPNGA